MWLTNFDWRLDKIQVLTIVFFPQLYSSLEKGQVYIFRVGSGQVCSINVSNHLFYIYDFSVILVSLEKKSNHINDIVVYLCFQFQTYPI